MWCKVYIVLIPIHLFGLCLGFEWPSLNYAQPESCLPDQGFDTINFYCFNCPGNATAFTNGGKNNHFCISRFKQSYILTSFPDHGCRCSPGFKTIADTGFYGGFGIRNMDPGLICEACPSGQVLTRDGRDCIKCPNKIIDNLCLCAPGEIARKRDCL